MKFGMVTGLANRHLLPEFGEFWPTFPGSRNFLQQISGKFLSQRYKILQR